jgi:hypothetical protein
MDFFNYYDWQPPTESTSGTVPAWVAVVLWVVLMVVVSFPMRQR